MQPSNMNGRDEASSNKPSATPQVSFKGLHVFADLSGIAHDLLDAQATIANVMERAIP